MTLIRINQRQVLRGLTLHVRVTGAVRARACIWIAIRLFHLASTVLGTKAMIDVSLDSPT